MTDKPNLYLVSHNPEPEPPTDYDLIMAQVRHLEARHRALRQATIREGIGAGMVVVAMVVVAVAILIYFMFQLGRGVL